MYIPSIYDQETNLSNIYEKKVIREKNNIIGGLLKNSSFLYLLEVQDKRLIPALTQNQMKGLKIGLLEFIQDKDGNILADLRKVSNGQIDSKISLKEVDISGSDINKINNIILQQQLNEVIKDLDIIKQGINEILAGQHNDRISKAKSAYSQYLLLSRIEDEEIRKMIKLNVINTSTESFFSIAETLSHNIYKYKEIVKTIDKGHKKILQEFVGIEDNKIQAIADDIFKQMEALFYAAMVRALAYSELNDELITASPINDLNLFLDMNMNIEIAIELNSWISINNNFWTKEYLPRKEKISNKLEQVEESILLMKGDKNENNEQMRKMW